MAITECFTYPGIIKVLAVEAGHGPAWPGEESYGMAEQGSKGSARCETEWRCVVRRVLAVMVRRGVF